MANEWTVIELYGPNGDGGKRRLTIADGAAVSIGAVLELVDPRTASNSHLASVPIGGVAAEEHLPNVGITNISVWTDGRFDATLSGAINAGNPVVVSLQDNKVQAASGGFYTDLGSGALLESLGAVTIGYTDELGSDGEVISIRLRL